jgi:TonB family protein
MKHLIFCLLLVASLSLQAQHVAEIGDQSKLATFPGGDAALWNFIHCSLKYPDLPIPPNKFSDKVMLAFNIDSSGKVCNISVINSIGDEFDEEAIRIMMSMPAWIPPANQNSSDSTKQYLTFYFNKKSDSELNKADLLYKKGVRLLQKGEFQKSIDCFTESINIRESNVDCYFNRAYAYIKLELTEKACVDLNKIKSVDDEANKLCKIYCK